MNKSKINYQLNKKDMLMLIMDYLRQEGFDRSYISLEEESKVNLYNYEERLVILRKCILDGEWDEAENFLEQLKKFENFPYLSLLFEIKKEKLIEEVESQQNENTLEELAQELKEIQALGQNEKFNNLIEYLKESTNHEDINNIISRRLNIFMLIRENMKFMHPVSNDEIIVEPGSLIFLLSKLIENSINNNTNNKQYNNQKEYTYDELMSILNNSKIYNNINNINNNINNFNNSKNNINSKIKIDLSNNEIDEEDDEIFEFDQKEYINKNPNKANSLITNSNNNNNNINNNKNINKTQINKNNLIYINNNNNNNNNYKNVNYQIDAFQEKNEISTSFPSQKVYKTNLERLADTYDDLDLNLQIQDNSSSLTQSKLPSKNINDLSDLDKEEYYMKNCYDYYNYDITSLTLKKVIEDTHPIRCCCYSPKGDYFAIGTNSKSLKIFDLSFILDSFNKRAFNTKEKKYPNQKEVIGMIFEEKDHHEGSIYCIDWSLSGKLIATGSNDKTIKLMSIPELIENTENDKIKNYTEPIELQITGNEGIVRSICFDPTSDLILLSANLGENCVKIWDTEKGENISILEGHNASVNCVKWSNDSQLFASSSLDKTIRFWDIREEKNTNLISGIQYANINDISIYSKKGINNTLIACGHSDGLVTIWDYNKRFVVKELYEHIEEVRAVNFSPDGKYLITGSFDSTIKIFDVNLDFKLMGQLSHKGRVVSCKWHPEIPIIISTSADCTARVWIPSKF